jgi:uncharacterized membrane protein
LPQKAQLNFLFVEGSVTNQLFSRLKPESVFLIISLIFGICLAVFVPYGAGYDEDSHIVRIFDIANGNLVPSLRDKNDATFTEFYTLSYQRNYLQEPASNYFSAENFLLHADRYNGSGVSTRSTYSPFVFLIEAVIARIAWIYLDLPILPVIISMRIAGLFLFIFAGVVSIKLLPTGKSVMAVLLLAPMSLFQASTLNGDRYTIGATVFFIAVVLRAFAIKERPLHFNDLLLIAVAIIGVGIAKPGTIIILPLLLILQKQKLVDPKHIWVILAACFFSVAYSVGWSFLAVLGTKVASTETTRAYQIQLVLKNFPDFLKIYFVGIVKLIPCFYTDWVAEYGYWIGKVPWPIYVLFPISLTMAFFAETRNPLIPRRPRFFVGILAMICLGLIASVKFVWAYVPGNFYYGSQGRYFLPFAPLLFIANTGWVVVNARWRKFCRIGAIITILSALLLYGYGVYRTYYTACIYAVDAQHPCTLPVYRNLDTENPINLPLTAGTTVEQTFKPNCDPVDAIDVRVLSLDGPLTGSVRLRLFDAFGELLQESQLLLKDVKVGEQNKLSFPDTPLHKNGTYSFELTLSEDTSAALGLWAAPEDGYTAGQLYINSSPAESAHDLYFQYECRR